MTADSEAKKIQSITVNYSPGSPQPWSANPDPLTVKHKGVTLLFNLLAPAPWVLSTTKPIVISGDGASTEFGPVIRNSDSQASVLDNNTKKAYFKYTVYVTDPVSGKEEIYDPGINNDPD